MVLNDFFQIYMQGRNELKQEIAQLKKRHGILVQECKKSLEKNAGAEKRGDFYGD